MKKTKRPEPTLEQHCKKCMRRLTLLDIGNGKVEKWCMHCDGPLLLGGS